MREDKMPIVKPRESIIINGIRYKAGDHYPEEVETRQEHMEEFKKYNINKKPKEKTYELKE
jgi:Ni/Co efflux regulator RcnB